MLIVHEALPWDCSHDLWCILLSCYSSAMVILIFLKMSLMYNWHTSGSSPAGPPRTLHTTAKIALPTWTRPLAMSRSL